MPAIPHVTIRTAPSTPNEHTPLFTLPCRSAYGELVKYWSLAQQLAVEGYFRESGLLTPMYYWAGISRTNKTVEYRYTLDGARLPQVSALLLLAAGNCCD